MDNETNYIFKVQPNCLELLAMISGTMLVRAFTGSVGMAPAMDNLLTFTLAAFVYDPDEERYVGGKAAREWVDEQFESDTTAIGEALYNATRVAQEEEKESE